MIKEARTDMKEDSSRVSSAKFPLHSLSDSFEFRTTLVSLLDMPVTEISLALTGKKVAWASVPNSHRALRELCT
jgi:hypothetical protein